MNPAHRSPSRCRLAVALFALLACGAAQADTYTYSGRLEEFGVPASGRYDLKLAVHADAQHGNTIVTPIEYSGVDVVNGTFKVDFDLPTGHDDAWVELSIRPAGSANWVALPGRTEAINAPTAIGQCWSTTGDSGSNPATNFLGTTDAQPLVLRTQNVPSLRIEPAAVLLSGNPITTNTIAGSSANGVSAGVRGATISGGGVPAGDPDPNHNLDNPNRITDDYGTVGGGYGNRAGDDAGTPRNAPFATVAGGKANVASGDASAVGGGASNVSSNVVSTVAGGDSNTASANSSTVSGGFRNTASGNSSTVVGGVQNTSSGPRSAVGGGRLNCAGASFAWAGGNRAKVRPGSNAGSSGDGCDAVPVVGTDGDRGTFTWADSQEVDFVSTGTDQFNIRAQGGVGINTPPRDVNVELTIRGRAGDAFGGNADVQLIVDNANQEGIQLGASNGGTGTNDANFEIAHSNGAVYAPRMTLFGSGAVTIRANNTGANTGVTMAANAGSWSSLSDRRVKTAILPVDATDVLSRVVALPMSTWSYIAQGEAIRHMGPMAQDFRAAFGLGENDTTIATVDADGVALAAIQGLNAKLEAQNAALLARIAALEAALVERERE
jgi:hypothetical protein